MKPKIIPIEHEVALADNEFIVSKTNTKGLITYINRTFMSISGYMEADLIGIQHNIVRHPDMPRAVYKLLWETLQHEKEFFGYVKNLCKDGSYYWVLANITPDYDINGQLRGYYSVRRKPSALALKTIVPIYKSMLDIEKNSSSAEAIEHSTAYLKKTLRALNLNYFELMLSLIKKQEQE